MDSDYFRRVLGNFPTGVVAITAIGRDGAPVGMAAGSFTSVSLDPPLVAFLPDKSSSTWAHVREAGSFCVNILAESQEGVCRSLAAKGTDKFAVIDWLPTASGSPMIQGAVAWIDCDIESIHDAGDHDIVVGRVRDLVTASDDLPLLFFRGGYGRFSPLWLTAWADDLLGPMHLADVARECMENLARDFNAECVASAVVGGDLVLIAASGAIRSRHLASRVGGRVPLMPPLGTVFVAFAAEPVQAAWIGTAVNTHPTYAATLGRTLEAVRSHGFAVDLGYSWHAKMEQLLASDAGDPRANREAMQALIGEMPPDYESPQSVRLEDSSVGTINVPVFDRNGAVVLALSVLASGLDKANRRRYVDGLLEGSAEITRLLSCRGVPKGRDGES